MKIWGINLGQTFFCAGALILASGCVGVVPRPVSRTQVEYGRQLKACDVSFVQTGVTTRTEILARLGTNFVALPMNRALAYTWEMKGGGGVWWVAVVVPEAAFYDAGTWEGGWRGFFIAFDDAGVVTARAHKKLSPRRSLHQHLYNWVETLQGWPVVASRE
jgi:hypothetical protein